jgi:erythromycin esterase-like protein
MFAVMGTAESWGIGAAGRRMPNSLLDQARRLVAIFRANRDAWPAQSSKTAYERARRHSEWILEWIAANKSELAEAEVPKFLPHTQGLNGAYRSICMANHLYSLADLPNTEQIVVWAHSYHVGIGIEDEEGTRTANMGTLLKERWGNDYYAVLFECKQGRFLARRRNSDDTLGEFLHVSIPRAPMDSLPGFLSRVEGAVFGLDLRGSSIPPAVESWLRAPRMLHSMGWACSEPPHLYLKRAIKPLCDALLYIEETTPTTPTQNARYAVARALTN